MSIPELSPIEERVVLLVAAGRSRQAIAHELLLGPRTVAWHLVRARRKLERAAALHERVQRAAPPVPPEGEER